MIRVLHLIDTGGQGGAERVLLDIVAGLDPSRITSLVAVPGDDWLRAQLVARGRAPVRIGAPGGFDLSLVRTIRGIVRGSRVDLVHAHLLTTAVYASVAAGLWGTPLVATFHGVDDIQSGDRFLRLKCRIINRGARRIVFVSDALRRRMLARTPLDGRRSEVIHNGIPLERYRGGRDDAVRRELGVADDEFLVGAVGNHSPVKGYEVLAEAAVQLCAAQAGFRFVVAGRVPPADHPAPRIIERSGLASAFAWLGPRDDVPRLLRALDAFVLPSHSEGFSLSLVEAMAAGVPAVATRSGGPEEIAADGRTGLLVDVAAPQQLAAAIARLRGDPDLRTRLSANAASDVAERFSVAAMVRSYERLYGDVCA